jgi:hypothetical protein
MRKLFLMLAFSALGYTSMAQSNMTLYNMEPIPQRLSLNPALAPDCKWYLGTPGISSTDFSFESNALDFKSLSNAFIPKAGTDSFVFDITKLSSILDKETYVSLGINQEWINFGFRINKSMFTFGVTEKVKTRIGIPNDLFKLVFEGNGGSNLGYNFNFNIALDVLHTREYSLGYNRSMLDDKLKIGGRLKYVQGFNVIDTKKNDIVFRTDPNSFAYKVTADIEVNSSSPVFADSAARSDVVKLITTPGGEGFGIDLGASYDLTDRIVLTASVVDVGRIKWTNNVRDIKSKNPGASFEYRGIDIREYTGDSTSGGRGFEALADTLLDVFALDTSHTSFSTGLLGEFYVGGNFKLNDRHNLGLLLNGSFYNKKFYPSMTLSMNSELGRILAVSASYTMMRGSFTNFGLGLGFNFGPEQFYLVSDNLIGLATGNVNTFSARFGWNHTVGRKKNG